MRFDSQDCFELCLDARHLPFGSGVASFMYSKKLRNINKAFFDPFAQNASWDIMEVAQTIKGSDRIVEWRIDLGDELDAEVFAAAIEKIDDSRLSENLADPKYGNYYRNLTGIIEHTHYHLGQIVLIKKWLNERT